MSLLVEETIADELDREVFIPLESFLHDEVLNERDAKYFSKGHRFQRLLSRLVRDIIGEKPSVDIAVAEYALGAWPSDYRFVRRKMGPTVFYQDRTTVAEIDLLAEYRSRRAVVPMIFEFTLSSESMEKQAKLDVVRRFYNNSEPYFCKIRPKCGDEAPGLYRYDENPLYRKIVLPVQSTAKRD
ncbi:MAG: hypothetical protein HY833_01730 [Candidatus Aenigmarchaeota archaeon]|nr:hypothetical protein [Candidatus Aenigmarchaeota archaeon]